jgi:2-dehydropantoate 2-reductase
VIARDGLQVTGATTAHVRPKVVTDLSADASASADAHLSGLAERYDVAVLTCKAYDTARLAAQVAPLVADDGVLASLQNGLGNDTKITRVRPAGRCALALTSNGVMIEKPGIVHHAGAGATTVGPIPPAGPVRDDVRAGASDERLDAARTLHVLLSSAGLAPAWRDDMRGPVWTKAIVNSGINPVAALHGVENGALLAPPLWDEVAALVAEGHALSRAVGVPLGDVVAAVREVARTTATNRCSMLQDVQAGKPTEIEQITGYLVRTARRLGFPMPMSDATYRAVKALEASYLGAAGSSRLTREEAEAWVAP